VCDFIGLNLMTPASAAQRAASVARASADVSLARDQKIFGSYAVISTIDFLNRFDPVESISNVPALQAELLK
jgi:hypothetical protein